MLLLALASAGISCADFGAGGTGETTIPRDRLRSIDRTDLTTYALPATTQPVEVLPTTLPSTQPALGGVIDLGLEDARQIALENNLDLRVQKFSPTLAAESLKAERAKFEAVFTTDIRYATMDQARASALNSGSSDSTSVSPGIRVPLYLGGAVVGQVPVSSSSTDNQFSLLNPAYNANPSLGLEMPLLRGFGVAANAGSIRVAFYANQQAEARTKLQVITVIANVDRLYWRLFAAQQEYLVRRSEFEVAAALLARNRRRMAAQVDPEVEVLRAESALADRLQTVQTAENTVRQRERELKRVLNKPELGQDSPVRFNLTTNPVTLYARLDRQALTKSAVANRMELLETELQLLSDTAVIEQSRNSLLPAANLTYTYRVNGLGQSFEEAFAQAGANRFADNTLGVSLELPIGNEAARARLRRALATRLQTLATKQQRIAQITQELLDAVDSLELNRANIVAAQRRVILNRRLLEAETRLLDAGQRTSTEVLQAQSNLANARLAEVQATTTFQISQVDIAFATGTLLGAGNIYWEPVSPPKVPRYIP